MLHTIVKHIKEKTIMEKREEIFSIAKEMMAAIYTKGEITDVDVVAETAIRYADALVKAYENSLLSVKDDCVKSQLPIYRKYYELKKKNPECLILFRCGDFYETYEDDAQLVSDCLGITLTKVHKTGLRMAGFPYHALDTYLPKLIREGFRVSINDNK
mgnify:CR=1 FL=1